MMQLRVDIGEIAAGRIVRVFTSIVVCNGGIKVVEFTAGSASQWAV
jgi:hypothetical protein